MFKSVRATLLSSLLLLPLCAKAQERTGSEVDIHSNVRLIAMPIPEDMPGEFKAKYLLFLQQLKESIKAKTSERTPENALTFQVRSGVKEVGSNKTKRPMASVVAFRKDSKSEYRGDILLYSYATGEAISKEEIDKFLAKQILNPLEGD